MKRLGLFGGTFDPIHNGHLHIARAFAEELALDSVIFIPAGDPYHKEAPTRTPAATRLRMVELAIADTAGFAVSDCDMVRSGATYTFDTVSVFRQAFAQAQLWWLMGMDALLHLHTWHRFQALLQQTNLAVAQRGDGKLAAAAPVIQQWVPAALTKAAQQPQGCDGGRLHILQAAHWPVSSTAIRHQCRLGHLAALRENVPAAVAAYIAKHHLYQA